MLVSSLLFCWIGSSIGLIICSSLITLTWGTTTSSLVTSFSITGVLITTGSVTTSSFTLLTGVGSSCLTTSFVISLFTLSFESFLLKLI